MEMMQRGPRRIQSSLSSSWVFLHAPVFCVQMSLCLTCRTCAALQMATLDKAEGLLENLRSASWDAAVKDLDDVKDFAAKQVRSTNLASVWLQTASKDVQHIN